MWTWKWRGHRSAPPRRVGVPEGLWDPKEASQPQAAGGDGNRFLNVPTGTGTADPECKSNLCLAGVGACGSG